MKNFKSFLIESETFTPFTNINLAIEYIFENCQQWFLELYKRKIESINEFMKIINDYSFYRGVNYPIVQNAIIEYARTNRKPLNSKWYIHNNLNKVFSKLGITVNRGNSIFCSNDLHEAKNYGNVYYVFPKDGYEYLFLDKIYDLYIIFDENFVLNHSNPSDPENLLFPNLHKYIKNKEKHEYLFSYVEKNYLDDIEYIFEIDEKIFQKIFTIKTTGISDYLIGKNKNVAIEVLIRPAVVLIKKDELDKEIKK